MRLRQRAEATLRERSAYATEKVESLSPAAMLELIHDLRLQIVELELQNDALRSSQVGLVTAAVVDEEAAFKQAVLNSVDAEIAVLNANGVIVAVNESWGRFARENNPCTGMSSSPSGIGTDYLAVCLAAAQSTPSALSVYDGIKQVIQGTLPRFTHEYDCHSPNQQRWFSMCVLPSGNSAGSGVTITHTDITSHKRAEEELRIAAVAFEEADAIVVMNQQRQILRVNQGFTQITGYSSQEVLGKTTEFLRSKRYPAADYEYLWQTVRVEGVSRAGFWLQCKSGEDFFAQGSTNAVQNNEKQTMHYVVKFSDQTRAHLQDQLRLQLEIAQREALVREVHHRVKNNLQGIRGLFAQLSLQKPEIADSLQIAVGHLNGIAIIHGLQGRRDRSTVRLCELTHEITQANTALWQTEIRFEIPENWKFRVVAEKEAVATALVLNELIVNAVKHGGRVGGGIVVRLRQGHGVEGVEMDILNLGHLHDIQDEASRQHQGLQLVESLCPRAGFKFSLKQRGDQVHTLVEFTAPLVYLESEI